MKVVVSLFPCMCLHFNEPFYLYHTKRINGPNIIRGWGRQREKQVANYILNLLGACKCRYYIIDVAFANAINIGAWFLGWRADAVEAVIESTGCSFELICGCIDEHIISTPKLISNGLWFLVLFWFDFIVIVNQTHWTHEWDVVSSNIQTQPTEMNFQQNNRNGNQLSSDWKEEKKTHFSCSSFQLHNSHLCYFPWNVLKCSTVSSLSPKKTKRMYKWLW